MSINKDKIKELFSTNLIDLAIDDLRDCKTKCEEDIETLLYSDNERLNLKLEHAIHKYKARFRNLGINGLTAILQEAENSVLHNQINEAKLLWDRFKKQYSEDVLEFYMIKDAIRKDIHKKKMKAMLKL